MRITIVGRQSASRPDLLMTVEGSRVELWEIVWRCRAQYRHVEWTVGALSAEEARQRVGGVDPLPNWVLEAMKQPGLPDLNDRIRAEVADVRRKRSTQAADAPASAG